VLTEPQYEQFARLYERGEAQLVTTRLIADLETPVSAMMRLAAGEPYSFLFESVEGGEQRGRYSIIGLAPDLIWRVREGKAEICRNPGAAKPAFRKEKLDPLASLRRLIRESRMELAGDLPPMAAGIFGYMGYDMVRLVEKLPDANDDPLGLPDAIMIRPTIILVFDAVRDEMAVMTPVRPEPETGAKKAWNLALERLSLMEEKLERPLRQPMPLSKKELEALPESEPVSNTSPRRYEEMVDKAQQYIAAGDIFQVVLSQRFEAPFALEPFALYRALRRTNPSPYLYYLDYGDFALVGSSPEILVRLNHGEVTIRPIAGTRKRGETPRRDRELAEELLADPKELSEHLMLLDLGRNDVGRVCRPGSVRVTDSFFLERYSHVMHIVSNVAGRLDEDEHDAIDALMAGFPAGTVSGAPKVRAMEIIDELERDRRGIYAGCVGYFGADGEMDSCIILRTAIVKDGRMYVQAGAGIVADSRPELEQKECVNKAKALFRAASEAARYASRAKIGQ
jgi:anthranilate synthase component 1